MDERLPDEFAGVASALYATRDRTNPPHTGRQRARRDMLAAHQRLLDKGRKRRKRTYLATASLALAAAVVLLALNSFHQRSAAGPSRHGHVKFSVVTSRRSAGDQHKPSNQPPPPGLMDQLAPLDQGDMLASQVVAAYGRTAPKVKGVQLTLQSETDRAASAYVARYQVTSRNQLASVVSRSGLWIQTAQSSAATFQGPGAEWVQAVANLPQWLASEPSALRIQPEGRRFVGVVFDSARGRTQTVTLVTVDRTTGLISEMKRTVRRDHHLLSRDVATYSYEGTGSA